MKEKYDIEKLAGTANNIYESYSLAIADAAKHSGITKAEADILIFFVNNPGCNRLSCIERLRGYTKAYIDEAASVLQKSGLLEISGEDTAVISGKGGIIGMSLKTAQQRFLDSLLNGVSAEERAVLENVRLKIEGNIDKIR